MAFGLEVLLARAIFSLDFVDISSITGDIGMADSINHSYIT